MYEEGNEYFGKMRERGGGGGGAKGDVFFPTSTGGKKNSHEYKKIK